MRRPLVLVVLAGLLLLGAAACSSGDDSSSAPTTASSEGAERTDDASEGGSVAAPDACPKVDAAAVAALGHSGPGKPSDYPGPPGTGITVCSFGEIGGDSGLLVVQIEARTADAVVDPIMTVLKNATRTPPTEASKPSGAKVYDIAIVPGGGGVGETVAWESDNFVVVAAQTGEDVATAQLENIVAGVVDDL